MIRLRGVVELRDGSLIEWSAGTAAIAEWELYAHRHELPTSPQAMPSLSMLVIAFYAIKGSLEGFETWRAGVVDVDVDHDDGGAAGVIVPPTLAEARGG